MPTNFEYLGTGAGIIKIVHIVFGLISVGCIGATYDIDQFIERLFLGVVIACFIVSFFYLILHLVSIDVAYSTPNRIAGAGYHFVGAILLIVAASLFLELVVSENIWCTSLPLSFERSWELCRHFDTKISGGAFGIINGVLYLVAILLTLMGGGEGGEVFDDDRVYKS